MDFALAGSALLTEGGPPSEFLQIVASGGVKVSLPADNGGEVVVDYRSEGAAFGYLSLLSGERSRMNATAVVDTVCYLIPRAPFLALLERRPQIHEFFTRAFIAPYLDKAFGDVRSTSLVLGGGEQMLFKTPVGQLPTREPVAASAGISIRDAAGLMSRNRVSSLVLVDAAGAPVGIVTDRDLRDKVAAVARDGAEPVGDIMSRIVVTVDAAEPCFDALVAMMRNNVHHLPVLEQGPAAPRDHQSRPDDPAREVAALDRPGDRRPAGPRGARPRRAQDRQPDRGAAQEGARAGNIARVITEINDRLVLRTLDLVGREIGPAPVAWSWIVFGSEGRREQTFKTDQDNAIVYAEPRNPEEARQALDWFALFTPRVRDALSSCGFPPCPAGYAASNPILVSPPRELEAHLSTAGSPPRTPRPCSTR